MSSNIANCTEFKSEIDKIPNQSIIEIGGYSKKKFDKQNEENLKKIIDLYEKNKSCFQALLKERELEDDYIQVYIDKKQTKILNIHNLLLILQNKSNDNKIKERLEKSYKNVKAMSIAPKIETKSGKKTSPITKKGVFKTLGTAAAVLIGKKYYDQYQYQNEFPTLQKWEKEFTSISPEFYDQLTAEDYSYVGPVPQKGTYKDKPVFYVKNENNLHENTWKLRKLGKIPKGNEDQKFKKWVYNTVSEYQIEEINDLSKVQGSYIFEDLNNPNDEEHFLFGNKKFQQTIANEDNKVIQLMKSDIPYTIEYLNKHKDKYFKGSKDDDIKVKIAEEEYSLNDGDLVEDEKRNIYINKAYFKTILPKVYEQILKDDRDNPVADEIRTTPELIDIYTDYLENSENKQLTVNAYENLDMQSKALINTNDWLQEVNKPYVNIMDERSYLYQLKGKYQTDILKKINKTIFDNLSDEEMVYMYHGKDQVFDMRIVKINHNEFHVDEKNTRTNLKEKDENKFEYLDRGLDTEDAYGSLYFLVSKDNNIAEAYKIEKPDDFNLELTYGYDNPLYGDNYTYNYINIELPESPDITINNNNVQIKENKESYSTNQKAAIKQTTDKLTFKEEKITVGDMKNRFTNKLRVD